MSEDNLTVVRVLPERALQLAVGEATITYRAGEQLELEVDEAKWLAEQGFVAKIK